MGMLYSQSATREAFFSLAACILILLGLTACGGGSSSGSPETAASFHEATTLISITFPENVDLTESTDVPPMNAPLSQQIVFTFSRPVEGDVDISSILIYSELEADYSGPTIVVDPEKNIIKARGTFEVISNVVIFQPYLATREINLLANAVDEELPGLLPDREYTIFVPVGGDGAIKNLTGIQPDVYLPMVFKTTSYSQLYYGNFPDDPPTVKSTSPEDGYAEYPVNTMAVMAGMESKKDITIQFDQPLLPGDENLIGIDGDGDGIYEPNFLIRYCDPYLFSTIDPEGALSRMHRANPSNQGEYDTLTYELDGQAISFSDICFDHVGRMYGLREGAIYSIPYKEPSDLVVAVQAVFNTGITTLKGLARSWEGHFLSVDIANNELMGIDAAGASVQSLGALEIASDEAVFDVAVGHDESLYLLEQEGVSTGNPTSVVSRIDADTGALHSEIGRFPGAFVSMTFVSKNVLYLYEKDARRFYTLYCDTGVWLEQGQGQVGTDHLDLATLFYEQDTDISLEENAFGHSLVSLSPKGMLPFDTAVDVLIRNRIKSLNGNSLSNTGNYPPLSSLSALSFQTVVATAQTLEDEFVEDFEDNAFEGDVRAMDKANASWNMQDLDGKPPFFRHLVATFGMSGSGEIGDLSPAGYSSTLYFDTDYQVFPLFDGSTPDVLSPIVVTDGQFNFKNIHIPQGVTVLARGSNPLVMTATGDVLIEGTIDISGRPGTIDEAFDSAFIPNPGGMGGPAGGRGGACQPTVPADFQLISQIHTAPTGEDGWGPRDAEQIGGKGGQTGAHPGVSYNGSAHHYFSRGSGGGGGSMLQPGMDGVVGMGTFIPDEHGQPIPCVEPLGGKAGKLVFIDGDPDNNFFGDKGEHAKSVGGQGGGGAGCRWDSLDPESGPNTPPNDTTAKWDAKGGGGGGGGGVLEIHALGEIVIAETGSILARGGMGGRGEQVGAGNFGGGGGGGSGGVVILQSGTRIVLEESSDPDPEAVGAIIDVTGGEMGEVQENVNGPGANPKKPCPDSNSQKPPGKFCSFARGDGGQGGFGLIQLMVEDPTSDLTPALHELKDAKIWIGATYFDCDPTQGERAYSTNDFPMYERYFFTYDPDIYPVELGWGDPLVDPFPVNNTVMIVNSPVVDPTDTISQITSVSYGLSKWINLGASVRRPSVNGIPAPFFPGFNGIDPLTGVVKTVSNGEVENYYVTGPDSNDIEVSAPSLWRQHYIHEDNEVAIEFQGAQAAAPGLSIPDENSITPWTSDINTLSGSQFIRFRVKLDASTSENLSLDSVRPQVDMVRIKAQY